MSTSRDEDPARLTAASALVLLIAVAALVTFPSPAHACDCPEPPPPEEAIADADAVFAGEVVETRLVGGEHDGDLFARIAVEDVWKGEVTETVEVRTAPHTATCGYHFSEGGRELVYAGVDDEGGFTTSLCSRTTPLDSAEEDLAALGEGDAPLAGERGVADATTWPWIIAGAAAVVALAVIGAAVIRRRPSTS